MWVSPIAKDRLRPHIVSHGFHPSTGEHTVYSDQNKLLSAFSWDGCRDYAAMLTIPSAIALWKEFVPQQQARRYMRTLLDEATAQMADVWGLREEDFPCPEDMRNECPMALVG